MAGLDFGPRWCAADGVTSGLPSGAPGSGRLTADRRRPTAGGYRRRWQALAVGLVAGFMTLLDVSIVNVALPSIRTRPGRQPSDLQWVLSGYALTFGLVLVPAGRFGDARGRRNVFVVGAGPVHPGQRGRRPGAARRLAGRRPAGPGRRRRRGQPQVSGLIQQLFRGRRAGPAVRPARRHDRHLHRGRAAARRRC